jgi:pyruvate ferredoxin oxidoreductase alpha subunit
MPFEVPDVSDVDKFLPPFQPAYALDPDNPANLNTVTLPELRPDVRGNTAPAYMEIRYCLHDDMRSAIDVVQKADAEYQKIIGRGGTPLLEPYRCDDADSIAVCLGSLSFQLRDVIDILRDEGLNIGVLGVRLYRPFPDEAIVRALSGAKVVTVFEKALSYGYQGPLFSDIKSALYGQQKNPLVQNYILGLGGREIKTSDLLAALRQTSADSLEQNDTPGWIGLKLQEIEDDS